MAVSEASLLLMKKRNTDNSHLTCGTVLTRISIKGVLSGLALTMQRAAAQWCIGAVCFINTQEPSFIFLQVIYLIHFLESKEPHKLCLCTCSFPLSASVKEVSSDARALGIRAEMKSRRCWEAEPESGSGKEPIEPTKLKRAAKSKNKIRTPHKTSRLLNKHVGPCTNTVAVTLCYTSEQRNVMQNDTPPQRPVLGENKGNWTLSPDSKTWRDQVAALCCACQITTTWSTLMDIGWMETHQPLFPSLFQCNNADN